MRPFSIISSSSPVFNMVSIVDIIIMFSILIFCSSSQKLSNPKIAK